MLASSAPTGRPANILPTSVRTAEAEALRLRHLGSVHCQVGGMLVLEKRASCQSVGRRPNRERSGCRGACWQSLAEHQRWPAGGWRLLLGESRRPARTAPAARKGEVTLASRQTVEIVTKQLARAGPGSRPWLPQRRNGGTSGPPRTTPGVRPSSRVDRGQRGGCNANNATVTVRIITLLLRLGELN